MTLEKKILGEKSKDRKKGAKDLGQAFLADLPNKRKEKYLKNPLKLITHLDILFLFHTSVSKRGLQNEFEDAVYYGLLSTTFYKMIQELEQVGALECVDNHYEFRKGKSKAGFDYSQSRGCRRKYLVCLNTPYFSKINPGSARWKALRELGKNCSINISRDMEERIKYPTRCDSTSPVKEDVCFQKLKEIKKLKTESKPLTSFKVNKNDIGEWKMPVWGQDFSDAVFVYNKETLKFLCSDLLTKTEKSLNKNLKKYIEELNRSLLPKINQNSAYEGFLRKIEPKCTVKTSASFTVELKTSWRASTAFSLCSKKDRQKMKTVFGWNASVDIASESIQLCSILGNCLKRVSNRSFYKKILKTLEWSTNPDFIKMYPQESEILEAIKKSVVRIMSVEKLSKLKTLLCNPKQPILPSTKYVEELYSLLQQTVGFFDSCNLFYYTSFIEIITLYSLRQKGIFVENCYDEFYYNSSEVSAKEIRDTLTESCFLLKNILENSKE